jgi:hypothetical protein
VVIRRIGEGYTTILPSQRRTFVGREGRPCIAPEPVALPPRRATPHRWTARRRAPVERRRCRRLEGALATEGAFVEECIHNCMHSLPPFAAPPGGGQFDALWDFALSHPYWLDDGESPYQVTGLPAGTPEWCAIGSGRAVERVGECPGTTPILGRCI